MFVSNYKSKLLRFTAFDCRIHALYITTRTLDGAYNAQRKWILHLPRRLPLRPPKTPGCTDLCMQSPVNRHHRCRSSRVFDIRCRTETRDEGERKKLAHQDSHALCAKSISFPFRRCPGTVWTAFSQRVWHDNQREETVEWEGAGQDETSGLKMVYCIRDVRLGIGTSMIFRLFFCPRILVQ